MTQYIATYGNPDPPLLSTNIVTPIDEALGAQFSLTWMKGPISRLDFYGELNEAQYGRVTGGRFGTHEAPTSRKLTLREAEEQVHQAGLDGRVEVEEGMRQGKLDLLMERSREEIENETLVARADRSLGTQLMLGATALGAEFVDPINLATLFVPGVGEAKLGYWIGKATARFGSALSRFAARAGVGAYEGATGTAITEPLDYALGRATGDDYDLASSLMNVGLGAVAGGVVHALGGVGIDLYRGMRLRRDLSLDAFGRVIDDSAGRLGAAENSEPFATAAAEHGATVTSDPVEGETSGFIAKASSLPPDTYMVVPSEAIDLGDLAGIKTMLRDYLPVRKSATEEIYRKTSGNDILEYSQTESASEGRETFLVRRLKPDDPNYAGPLSERRMVEDAEASRRASRLLYMKAPEELNRKLTHVQMSEVAKLNAEFDDDPLKLYPPEADGGHKVDNAIGTAAHTGLGGYADGSKVLHRAFKLDNKVPDSFLSTDHVPLAVEMKPESLSGILKGKKQALGYQETFGVEAVVLLYRVDVVRPHMDALIQKVVGAWDQYNPLWREFLTKAGKKKLVAAGKDPRQYLPKRGPHQPASRPRPDVLVQKVNNSRNGRNNHDEKARERDDGRRDPRGSR
ncbi:hypothetical protein [Dongia sp.]|uniref:hypothetical protein n=1 Tax=Dongia sp. TaxID=1977262 RepID=UPI0037535BA4